MKACGAGALATGLLLLAAASGRAEARLPEPSPYAVLPSRAAASPAVDAPPVCRTAPGDATFEAIRSATAPEGGEPPDPRSALDELARSGEARVRACAHLELARLELLRGHLPEARVQASRAERAFADLADAEPPRALREAARFYRAEALHRDGRSAEAAPLYAGLAEARGVRIRAAARLRRAELAGDLEEFARGLARGTEFGAEPARWGARAAELALEAGDLEAARRWLSRLDEDALDADTRALVGVRRADVLFALGADEEARAVLRGIAARHAGRPVGELARVRLVHTGLAPTGDREVRRRLTRIASGGHRSLATYARGVLAGRLRAAGEVDAALELLVKLATDARAAEFVPDLAAETDAALQAATAAGTGCVDVTRRLAGRRSLLLRHGGVPDPFLRLGDCLLELGFAGPALDVYRGVTRRFGVEVVPRVSLRTARASFEAGRIAAARAPAEANLSRALSGREVPELGAWTLLLARIELHEERPAEALELLEPALVAGSVDAAREPEAVRVFALAALRVGAGSEARATLRSVLSEAPAGEAPARARLRHEALLHAADLHRAAGDRSRARSLYGRAAALLDAGPLRARALYWNGELAAEPDDAREAWRASAAEPEGGPWARLAADELEAIGLREAIGVGRRELRGGGDRP